MGGRSHRGSLWSASFPYRLGKSKSRLSRCALELRVLHHFHETTVSAVALRKKASARSVEVGYCVDQNRQTPYNLLLAGEQHVHDAMNVGVGRQIRPREPVLFSDSSKTLPILAYDGPLRGRLAEVVGWEQDSVTSAEQK